jgi:hypothetical protein
MPCAILTQRIGILTQGRCAAQQQARTRRVHRKNFMSVAGFIALTGHAGLTLATAVTAKADDGAANALKNGAPRIARKGSAVMDIPLSRGMTLR